MKKYKSIMLATSMVFSNFVMAAPGDLDVTFGGGDGLVSTGFQLRSHNDNGRAVVQQADGKLVIAGYTFVDGKGDHFALARYNSNGTLDVGFGSGGKVLTTVGSSGSQGYSLIQQADGKLVVGGRTYNGSNYDIALVRYNSDASLDTSFSGDGKVTTSINATSNDEGYSVIQQTDGKLVVAGYTNNGTHSDVAIVRYNTDGSLDTTFDIDGMVATDVAVTSFDYGYSIIQQTDGKLVVAGSVINGFLLIRYNSNGSLDTTFDTDGKVITDVGASVDKAYSVIQQSDGKLVAAGYSANGSNDDVALVRYNTNGSLDTTFDTDGKVTTDIAASGDAAYSVVQQPDGKLVVAGGNGDFLLIRYNSNGSLDTAFDGDGKVITAIGASVDMAYSLIRQSDGKLVAAGYSANGSDDVALVRYNSNGSLDTAFDTDGKATTNFTTSYDGASSLIQQSDGKLVAAGASHVDDNTDFALVRYNSNGSLDTSFDGDGKVTTAMGVLADSVRSIIQQADGRLVVAGISRVGTTDVFALARYNSDGSLDASFDGDGKLTTDIGSADDVVSSMIQQSDGKLVAAGSSFVSGNGRNFTLVRYNSDGSLDASFDGDGIVTTNMGLGSADDEIDSVLQQADGKLVAAGYRHNGSETDIALARYNSDGSLDATFDTDGKVVTTLGVSVYEGSRSLIQQSDGKLVLASRYSSGCCTDEFALVRYNSDGSLDATFDADGMVITDISSTRDFAQSVIQQSDGKLVLAGNSTNGSNGDIVLVRYNSDGSLDTNFSGDGKLITAIGSGSEAVYSVIQQSDGKLAVAGSANSEFMVARYESGQLDTDADGVVDWLDTDNDGDGVLNVNDAFPLNAAEWLDTDSDGTGNNADTDDDNDGVLDVNDKFPLDANRWLRSRHNTDFDNDSDILVRSASTGSWTRYSIQNNTIVGNGAINAPTSSDSVYVAQLDANGDGDADILTRSASTGAWSLSIVESGAVTSSVPLYLYANLGYVFVGTGDFNNDGVDDVMLRHATNGYRVFLLANHAVSSSVYYNAWTGASSVDQGIGDFNGDGTDDLLVRRTSDNLYFIFKTINGAVNNYYCACNIWANTDWTFQFAGDTNKDGIDDVVIRGTGPTADGKWWAFRMNNFKSSLYTNLNLFINKTAITVGAVGDYNGDGTVDVLTRVNNSTTYVSPITNGTVGGNYLLYNFTADQVIGK